MLNFFLVLISQIIKPQAVLFRVHNGAQLGLKHPALGRVQQALKHRVLHPLSIIDALLGDLPQPFPAGGCFRIDIISNQHQHFFSLP